MSPNPRARRPARPRGAQGAPAGRVVLGRLCRHRDDPADRRRGAVRGPRRPRRTEGARRRRRQRQRLARGRAPLVRRGRHRLRARAARARPRARRRRAARHRVPRSRRGGAAVSGRELRRGRVDLRGDVHARPGHGGEPRWSASCKPGGKIGLANWTPEGFIGQVFKTIGQHVPPPPGARSPALWGTRARIAELFGLARGLDHDGAAALRVPLPLAGALARGLPDLLRPAPQGLRRAGAGSAARRSKRDLLALIDQFNRARDGSMVVPGEYLEVVITRD